MNAWNAEEMKADESGLTESCDKCNRLIHNWDWLSMSFLDFDGRILCMWCKSEFIKECIKARQFDKIGVREEDLI